MLVNCLFRCECNFRWKKVRWFLSTCFHTAPCNFLQFNLHQCFLQKIIRRSAAFKGSRFKRPAFTFPIKQFKLNLFNDSVFQRAAKRDTCIWLSLYCVELSTGSKLQNILQLVCCCFFLIVAHSILGDPGDVSRVGRKGATMVFKHGLKSTKNLFLFNIVPTNRRTASPVLF